MLLSSRSLVSARGLMRAPSVWGALALLAAPCVQAQQWLFSPVVQVSGEWDTNRLLTTNGAQKSEWGEGLFATDITRNTGTSLFEFRPEIIAQDSSLSLVDTFEALVNTRYNYQTLKSDYEI